MKKNIFIILILILIIFGCRKIEQTGGITYSSKQIKSSVESDIQKQVNLAKDRQNNLLSLIEKNPEAFLRVALPKNIKNKFSLEVQKYIEEEVELEGELQILHMDDFENKVSKNSHFLKTKDGKRYQLHFPKDYQLLPTKDKIKIHGIKINNKIAIFPSIKNLVKVNEPKNIKNLNTAKKTQNKLTGKVVSQLPKIKKVAVILFNFQNDQSQPFTRDYVRGVVFTNQDSVNNYYKEISFNQISLVGKYNLDGDIFGWYTIPYNNDTCKYEDLVNWMVAAETAIELDGFSLSDYDNIIHIFPPNDACLFGGWAFMPGNVSLINGLKLYGGDIIIRPKTIAHELGHNFGVSHSSIYICDDGENQRVSINNPELCSTLEYFDYFDVMGYGFAHMNGLHKDKLGWLRQNNIRKANLNVNLIVPIQAIETPSLDIQSLVIPTNRNDFSIGLNLDGYYFINKVPLNYYLEYRKKYGFDSPEFYSNNFNGVFLRLAPNYYPTIIPSRLIDAKPISPWNGNNLGDISQDFLDSALGINQFFIDNYSGINIETLSMSQNNVDVNVTFFTPPCVRVAPKVYFSPYFQWGQAGQVLSYDAIMINNDNSACGSSTFYLKPKLSQGWSQNPSISEVIIPPGDLKIVTFTLQSPLNRPSGPNSIHEEVINRDSINYNTSNYVYYQIYDNQIENVLQIPTV